MTLLLTVIVSGIISLSLADPIKWCVISNAEMKKCIDLKSAMQRDNIIFECIKKINVKECLTAIKKYQADAITVDGGDIYEGGLLSDGRLKPILAEQTTGATCYYAVAVVKASSTFGFNELEGKKSCHTGLGKSAGWISPMGALLIKYPKKWNRDDKIEQFASHFFSASCVPGAEKGAYPSLCRLCKKNCQRSHSEPYYGYTGAFNCLKEGAGNVAFVKHTTVPADEKQNYRLLCKDGTRKNIDDYKDCNLARVPAHAVMVRSNPAEDAHNEKICTFLSKAQEQFGQNSTGSFKLFQSAKYGQKNLMFKDSTEKLVHLPKGMDYLHYLGASYVAALRAIKKESTITDDVKIRWCTIGEAEEKKCDYWAEAVNCVTGVDAEDCIKKIMSDEIMNSLPEVEVQWISVDRENQAETKESKKWEGALLVFDKDGSKKAPLQFGSADAVTLDGGQIYLAEKCGLVAVMAEYYNKHNHAPCKKVASAGNPPSYYAVAVVKDPNLTWDKLKDKKSCHTAIGRTAGWNTPMGTLIKEGKIRACDIYNSSYFSESCAPGADKINERLCSLCIGMKDKLDVQNKCAANNNERYFGYAGAFRCLVESGDVAFIKHTTVPENTDGNGVLPWNENLTSSNYHLLCTNNTVVKVDEYLKCHLAKVPAHAVVTRPDKRAEVVQMLKKEEEKHGINGTLKSTFEMFSSKSSGKDLLFKDSTQCLIEIHKADHTSFLDKKYLNAMVALNSCKPPELLNICSFEKC